VDGGCHCRNIILRIELPNSPGSYNPRACDCDFCGKHAASYVSDAHGSLLVEIAVQREVGSCMRNLRGIGRRLLPQ
jgi:hypothetical protein